ncbi:MAG: type II toxin-antitoxin system RelE/ParE family toxin [Bacteroidota bacterium]|nr:type II toxin-antitoxin system RelE/ParE family toxin [Bacteroidota bacterium]
MSYTYWLHEKIQKDLNEGFTWYEERQSGLGHDFLEAIEKKIYDIIDHPEAYGSKGNPQYREASLKRFPYVIVLQDL